MGLFGPPNVEKMKAKSDIRGLVKALGYEKSPDVSQSASQALVEMGAAAVHPLIAAFQNDPVPQLAIETLVKIGEPSIRPLIKALRHYAEQKSAIKALRQIGEPAIQLAVDLYISAMFDTKSDDLPEIINALTTIGAPAVEPLVAVLTNKQASEVYTITGHMLITKTETQSLIPHLGDRIHNFWDMEKLNINLQGLIAGALGEIGDCRAVEALIPILQEEDKLLRCTAAGALFRIGDNRAVEHLISSLRDEDVLVSGGPSVWGVVADGQTVKSLLTNVINPDSPAQEQAAQTLNELGWKAQSSQNQ